MKTRGVIMAGLVLGLVAATLLRAAPEAAPPKAPEELLKAKVEAARRTYEVVWKNNREGFVPVVELCYRWSRRWLEAELELHEKKADQEMAYQAHAERMRELARITRDRFRNRVNTVEEVTAIDFYTAEARVWLEQARIK
jgi:hypothetical protein